LVARREVPLLKQVRFLLYAPELRTRRPRALLASGLSALLLATLLLGLPVTSLTRFEGVIWPPEESQLVTATDGFVAELLAEPGQPVTAGEPLIQLANTELRGRLAVKRVRMRELTARFRLARVRDRVKTRLVQEEITGLQAEIDRLQEKIEGLLMTSPAAGIFVLPSAGGWWSPRRTRIALPGGWMGWR
jgi:putative peptide zinc metalloprotease protein